MRMDENLPNRRRRFVGAIGALVVGAGSASARAAGRAGLVSGEGLARYGFSDGHPLGIDRQGAFLDEARRRGLLDRAIAIAPSAAASREVLMRFHTGDHVDLVARAEADGLRWLDDGDTPVFPGVYEASAIVVGSAVAALDRVMRGECLRTLQPVGGLHHASRSRAAGFCVFNDVGVVIETLRAVYGVRRVAYIDIDVHHGDGVFYAFEEDPDLIFADIHEDGRHRYPGTGHAHEVGRGAAAGTKINLPLPRGAGDDAFLAAWSQAEAHLERHAPEFFVFQCGADGLAGDPLADLALSSRAHRHVATRLRALADRHAGGRLMAFGGGGYSRNNLAAAWCEVLGALTD
jgi:acetoin utilization protein AcuC